MWDRFIGLYIAAIVAGFALAFVPTSAIITAQIKGILVLIGGIVVVIFAFAIILHALRELFGKHLK